MKNYILLILCATILFSCKARKNVPQPSVNTDTEILSNKDFFEKINKKQDFESIKISSNISVETDRYIPTVDAIFYVENNQKIWVNLSFLYMTQARAIATPSGIKAYEKINKTYIDSDFTYINKLLNVNFVDYNSLQNLLLGKTFVPVSENNYNITKDESGYILNSIKTEKITVNNKYSEYNITLNYTPDFILKQVNMQKNNSADHLQVVYDDYEYFEGKKFPKNVKIIIKGQKNSQILIENTKFDFLKMETPFSIPANYTKNTIK